MATAMKDLAIGCSTSGSGRKRARCLFVVHGARGEGDQTIFLPLALRRGKKAEIFACKGKETRSNFFPSVPHSRGKLSTRSSQKKNPGNLSFRARKRQHRESWRRRGKRSTSSTKASLTAMNEDRRALSHHTGRENEKRRTYLLRLPRGKKRADEISEVVQGRGEKKERRAYLHLKGKAQGEKRRYMG